MSTVKINFNTDSTTKEEAQALFSSLGMDMTTAINIFLNRAILEQGIPFEVSIRVPNRKTLNAMLETEDMINHPNKYKKFNSIEELRKDLNK